MPTRGEFIAHARMYGLKRRVLVLEGGPRGSSRLVYLWRDADHFAELPDVRYGDRLTRDTVATLWGRAPAGLDRAGADAGGARRRVGALRLALSLSGDADPDVRRRAAGSALRVPRRRRSAAGASLPRRGVRADLAVGAESAGAVGRRRLEGGGGAARRARLDGGDRRLGVRLRRRVAPDYVRLDEAQLHALREGARHLPPREGVDLELQALGGAAVGVLLLGDLARLVVDDRRPQQVLVHPVEAPAHAVGAEAEAEVLLDRRGLGAAGLLLVPEARQGLVPGGLARLLVLPREEPLVVPLARVAGQQVLERGVVARARQVQLAPGARHADVEQAALLLQVVVARRQRVLDQLRGHLERLAAPPERELVLREVHEEDHGELEALRLMDGEHVDGGRLDVRLRHRRVLPRVDQRVEVVDELAHVVVAERLRGVLDAAEEPRDVLHFRLLARARGLGHAREPARVHQELVEQLARRHLARQLHVAREVGHEPADRVAALGAHLVAHALERLHAAEHVEQPAVPAVRVRRAAREVDDRHLGDVRGRQGVHADRVVRVRDRAQERDEEPDLRPAVEPGVARERPRNPTQVERAQELVGVVVRAHEDGDVVVPPRALVRPLADHMRDRVRLLRRGLVVEVHRLPAPAPL